MRPDDFSLHHSITVRIVGTTVRVATIAPVPGIILFKSTNAGAMVTAPETSRSKTTNSRAAAANLGTSSFSLSSIWFFLSSTVAPSPWHFRSFHGQLNFENPANLRVVDWGLLQDRLANLLEAHPAFRGSRLDARRGVDAQSALSRSSCYSCRASPRLMDATGVRSRTSGEDRGQV